MERPASIKKFENRLEKSRERSGLVAGMKISRGGGESETRVGLESGESNMESDSS